MLYHKAVVVGWSVLPNLLRETSISEPKKGHRIPNTIPRLLNFIPSRFGFIIKKTPIKPIIDIKSLNKPTFSFIRIGARIVIKRGIVFNKVVIKLKSKYPSAAKRKPNENKPVIVLIHSPNLD